MTHLVEPMERLVALCAEGARKFGDNPVAIADFIEKEIGKLPANEQRKLTQELALLTDRWGSSKPVS